MAVKFFFLSKNISLSKRRDLKSFLEYLFINEKRGLESLTYIFCSDEYLLKINQDFLKHNYYTDIISFDMSEGTNVIGEIYISTDRVRENAKNIGASITDELHRVIFHGALHLCGYKDKSNLNKKEMRAKEDYYIGQFLK